MGRLITTNEKTQLSQLAREASAFYCRQGLMISADVIYNKLLIVHRDIVQLRLDDMLNGEISHVMHDIGGIRKHLVHDPVARLTDCFHPRYAVPEAK